MASEKKTTVYVTGDTIKDHHIYIKEKETGSGYPETVLVSRVGGAKMLHDIVEKSKQHFKNFHKKYDEKIKELKKKNRKPNIDKIKIIEGLKNLEVDFCIEKSVKGTYTPKNYNSFLYWNPYKDKDRNKSWRIDKKIGFGDYAGTKKENIKLGLKDIQPTNNDYLIIDDAGIEYREAEEVWKPLLEGNKYKHIILKMSHPVARGSVFKELIKNHKDNLTIITSASELRKGNIKISKGVSWEQSMSDLVIGLEKNQEFKLLKQCKTLIVTFSTEGAFYLTTHKGEKKSRMIFDNSLLEGEFVTEKNTGGVIGYQNTFVAGYLAGLILEEAGLSNTEIMISASLSAIRQLAKTGHLLNNGLPGFPYDKIINEFFNPSYRFASAFVPQPDFVPPENFGNWSILKGNYALEEQTEPLFNEAILHILDKKNGLANTPHFKVKYFFTVDRNEIEGLRNIKQLIQSYDSTKEEKEPLSIGVFGSPGSGKSFVVKQLQKGIPVDNTSFLEFNLSQFSNPDDIVGALHQVRDEVLDGKLPFVFWDEFDSKEYMWLQYLLAPMQDGQFQEGQITHNIGRCVFVFAGGTSYDFEHFGPVEPKKPEIPKDKDYTLYGFKLEEYNDKSKKYENFKLKKGPDFKSRLNGYLNVMGPNQEYNFCKETEGWDELNENDIYFPVRRAILFNALSGFDASKSDIDFDMLNAIIKIDKYKHGARSFEKVIKSIFSNNNGKMLKSNLPPDTLLNSHVVKSEFVSLMDGTNKLELIANKIAPLIHQNWMALGDKDGWKLEYYKEFNYLPSHIKQDNIEAAKRIPKILEAAGYEITENPEFDNSVLYSDQVKNDATLCDKLAIIEHKEWMKFKRRMGWKKGKRNDDKKLHNCIDSFENLSNDDQEKDRDAIRNIPTVLKNAGLYIKKI